MPKATLVYKLPEELEEYQTAMRGINYKVALDRVSNEIFRPARKHGYSDSELQKMLEENPWAVTLVSLLEERFYEILVEEDAND